MFLYLSQTPLEMEEIIIISRSEASIFFGSDECHMTYYDMIIAFFFASGFTRIFKFDFFFFFTLLICFAAILRIDLGFLFVKTMLP